MADSVYIIDVDYQYRLQWETDGEPGALLGDVQFKERDFENSCIEHGGDRWFIAATLDVAALKPNRDSNGFYFEAKSDAQRALKVAKAAKHRKGPMPDWAVKAVAAGWKAPKGWHP